MSGKKKGDAHVCKELWARNTGLTRRAVRLVADGGTETIRGGRSATLPCTLTLAHETLQAVAMNQGMFEAACADETVQTWTLVAHELLDHILHILEQAAKQRTLDILMNSTRLYLRIGRLEKILAAHVISLRSVIKRVDDLFLGITIKQGDVTNQAQPPLAPLQESPSDIVQRLKMLIQENSCNLVRSELLIDDMEGRKWWLETFGNQYAIPWTKFHAALANHQSDPAIRRISGGSPGFLALLQRTVSPDHVRKAVTVKQFSEFLWSFGPGIRVALLQMCAEEKSAPWFAGALNSDEARAVLNPYSPGSFLVRFSESACCTWAVSYCNAVTGVVNHALIRASSTADSTDKELNFFESGRERYSTFEALISDNSDKLRYPVPGIKNIGPARFFRGFLTFEEADEMLEEKPVGTFLIRFSANQQSCLVVAYVAADGKVKQSKIFCDPQRGFLLSNLFHKRIPDLVQRNGDKLCHPLEVPSPDSFLGQSEEELDKLDESLHMDNQYAPFQPAKQDPSLAYFPLAPSDAYFSYGRLTSSRSDNSDSSGYGAIPTLR